MTCSLAAVGLSAYSVAEVNGGRTSEQGNVVFCGRVQRRGLKRAPRRAAARLGGDALL